MKRFLIVFLLASSAFAQSLPKPDHVVIVIEENKGFADVIGSAKAPYINSLAAAGASLTAYSGLHHPSQPNYIELFSGAEHGVCNDSCVTSPITAVNLAASLFAAGKTFIGYADGLPDPITACKSGFYARKHCPWINFTGVPMSATADFKTFPRTNAGFASLPTVSFVIPTLDHDMHDPTKAIPTAVHLGDDWLKKHLEKYRQWAMTNNSLLIVTWDEDSSSYKYPTWCGPGINTTPPANRIPTIVVVEHVKPGSTSAKTYTHYNLLRTIEDMYGLPAIGGSATAGAIDDIWQ